MSWPWAVEGGCGMFRVCNFVLGSILVCMELTKEKFLSYRYVVGVVFGFEHILLVIAVILQHMVHPVPKWVRIAIARREYLSQKRGVALTADSSGVVTKKEKTS